MADVNSTAVLFLAGLFLVAFMKGALGGGFAIMDIPLLSRGMDPLMAGALLAPLFVAMDLFALRYWKPSTWSKQDLKLLVPSLLVVCAARPASKQRGARLVRATSIAGLSDGYLFV